MQGLKLFFTSLAAACLLVACGGGGDSGDSQSDPSDAGGGSNNPPQQPGEPVKGVWIGSLFMNDLEHDHPYDWDATAVVLEDGRFFLLNNHYYHTVDETIRNSMGGLLIGKGTARSGSFSVQQSHQINFEPWPDGPATIAATYTAQDVLGGKTSYPALPSGETPSPRDLSTRYSAAHAGTASLDDLVFNNEFFRSIQGTVWAPMSARSDGLASFKTTLHLVVDANGNLSSRFVDGCLVSGRLTPHPGLKVFDASITFDSAACPYQGQTLEGVAFVKDSLPTLGHPTPTPSRFHLLASTADMTGGIVFSQILDGAVQPEDQPPVH